MAETGEITCREHFGKLRFHVENAPAFGRYCKIYRYARYVAYLLPHAAGHTGGRCEDDRLVRRMGGDEVKEMQKILTVIGPPTPTTCI